MRSRPCTRRYAAGRSQTVRGSHRGEDSLVSFLADSLQLLQRLAPLEVAEPKVLTVPIPMGVPKCENRHLRFIRCPGRHGPPRDLEDDVSASPVLSGPALWMIADALPFNPFVLAQVEHLQFENPVIGPGVALQYPAGTVLNSCLLVPPGTDSSAVERAWYTLCAEASIHTSCHIVPCLAHLADPVTIFPA